MKRLTVLVTILLLGVGLTAPLTAQGQTNIKIGPRVGIPVGDISDLGGNFFFGVDGRIASEALPVVINPSFDYYLMDDYGNQFTSSSISQTVFTIDVNALYEFGVDNQAFAPYAGGGLGIVNWSVDTPSGTPDQFDPGTTDVGLNLVGGARFPLESVEPFAELNVGLGGDLTRFAINGGVLFSL